MSNGLIQRDPKLENTWQEKKKEVVKSKTRKECRGPTITNDKAHIKELNEYFYSKLGINKQIMKIHSLNPKVCGGICIFQQE